MKIRFTKTGLRFRLTQTEVKTLADTGALQEDIPLRPISLSVGIKGTSRTSVAFTGSALSVEFPAEEICAWASGNEEAIRGQDGAVAVSVEKDFACLHPANSSENADCFPNPSIE